MKEISYWNVLGNGCAYKHSSLESAIDDTPDSTTRDAILKITYVNGALVSVEIAKYKTVEL
ncbi:MAG: hypothetical protein ACRDAM_15885 [Casimicrobium sp.]